MKRVLHPGWNRDPGCRAKPLFEIPLDRVVVDELHMFLRITDILERGIIYEVINWDEVLKFKLKLNELRRAEPSKCNNLLFVFDPNLLKKNISHY